MTRATLLRLLAHPTALNGADVRALEELAEAFPYCQTAHLLLAKAAHDQGSMLAGQRLRRAATYAADRSLLRQLVEAAPVEELAEAVPAAAAITSAYAGNQPVDYSSDEPAAPAKLLLEDKPAQEITPAPSPTVAEKSAGPDLALTAPAGPAAAPLSERPSHVELPLATPTTGALAEVETPAAETEPASTSAASPAPANLETPASPVAEAAPAPVAPTELPGNTAPHSEQPSEAQTLVVESETQVLPATAETEETAAELIAVDAFAVEPEVAEAAIVAASALGAELPPQAPPIRPPAEAEAARQEFGLTPDEPAEITAYQLPELELAITIPLTPADATPRLPPFSGVADVVYAPSEGSRFGYCLVATALPLGEEAAPLVPGAPLPPPGEFFAPDALMLAHAATLPAAPTNTTTDLINSFLLRTPGNARRRTQPPAKTGEQADLSVRSTRAAPDLASESLARILTQQGKIEQAIAIYERLMVKNPEKVAYFAAQIDLLRP